MLVRIEPAVESSTIRLEGVFDGIAARRVETLLARSDPGTRLSLDLSHVREFHDFGVSVLAQALTRTKAEVTVRGLRQHQVRVLRYCGVDTAPLERAVLSDAA
jgi:anti-anti-sigma regulatory factor